MYSPLRLSISTVGNADFTVLVAILLLSVPNISITSDLPVLLPGLSVNISCSFKTISFLGLIFFSCFRFKGGSNGLNDSSSRQCLLFVFFYGCTC